MREVRPIRRTYSEHEHRRTDVDSVSRARLVQAFMLSLSGLVLGGLASVLGMSAMGWSGATAGVVTLGTWAAAFVFPVGVAVLSGRAAATIHNPSGRSTPRRKEYSRAESLLARGLHSAAIDAFEDAILEDPSDATPYLRIARIHRDHLGDFGEAERWFKRVLAEAVGPPATAHLVTRELVELYTTKMDDPVRAAPLLARIVEERGRTPEAAWAKGELQRVKSMIREREEQ